MGFMRQEFFRKLAKEENGKFYHSDEDLAIGFGVRSPDEITKVIFEYNDSHFQVANRNGTAFVGTIRCTMALRLKPIAFEIEKLPYLYKRLFRKKHRLQIKTESHSFKSFLENNDYFKILNHLADTGYFNPLIMCKQIDKWMLITEYPLEYGDWKEVIPPIIGLYKDMLDEFER